MGEVSRKLAEMGLELPPRRSAGNYAGAVRSGKLVFASGAGPGSLTGGFITGKVGGDVGIERAQEGARLCVLGLLSALEEELGDLDRVKRIAKVMGFVNSAPGFNQQHVVMDGASGLLVSLFGERGVHARSSVGVAELPMNIAVEVELIAEAD